MIVKVWKDKKDYANRTQRLKAAGFDIEKTYTENELAKGNEMIFAALGVTKLEKSNYLLNVNWLTRQLCQGKIALLYELMQLLAQVLSSQISLF
jgi:fructose-1,6-bisphosphatase/sedoheptulose 1,7-bisphosphatase-like protein